MLCVSVSVWSAIVFLWAACYVHAATPPAPELERAETLIRQGKIAEAITSLEEVRQKQPALPGLDAKLGKAYYQKRHLQQANARFQAALERNPEDQESLQLLGLSYYSAGQLEQAIPPLERIQSRLPATEFDTSYLLGVCYLRTGRVEKAREAFSRLFSVAPGSATAHLLLARMMVRQRLEERAIPELQRAIALDARLPMVHFMLGELYLFQSKPELALAEFRSELDINPTVWLVYWRLGDAYARLNKFDEAEKALKQAIWFNESFSSPYVLLGQIGIKKGDLELARGFLERALKMDPNNYLAHLFLGRVFQQSGRPEDARRQFELSRSLLGQKNSEDVLPELQDGPPAPDAVQRLDPKH
jgi:tetratricopeptide (TPR) repeat protein